MSFNPTLRDPNVREVPLSVFGSLVTEMAPVDCPEGVSPDCADCVFVPGSVASRPALEKVFATPFPNSPTLTYGKSYVMPSGDIRNLFFDSKGILWVEDFSNSPGTKTQLLASTPGCYAKSITAFGREYIAISDGLHGQEVPLQYDGTYLDRVTQDGPGAPPSIANVILAASTLTGLVRSANVVTASTAAAHNFKPGYQAQIAGVAASAIGGGITTIVIDNENLPGLATVGTNSAHGLVPGISVTLNNIPATTVANISSIVREGDVVTVTTAAAHGLSPGASATVGPVTDPSFNGTFVVAQVTSSTTFVYPQVDNDSSSSGGVVNLNWPIPDTPTPSYFAVVAAPTSTTFQVAVSYSDGTWNGGTVSYAWAGTFFVLATPSTTAFTYTQYGPNASISTSGSATPYGQAAPGVHQMQVLFLTRQGAITKPSPPVTFVANGGQYLSATNIPIGPSNVVARILAFTGAGGAYFFYIPTAAQVNGQLVSTATQINDNSTTSAVLDFSDNTLFAALGLSIPGNNLANQIVLDGALGFGFYSSRLIALGMRNRVQNLLNMGFDGGYLASATTRPLGWTVGDTASTLAAGHIGTGWQMNVLPGGGQYGTLSQPAYQDAYGAPIAAASTLYRMRAWLKPSALPNPSNDLTFTATLSSATTGFSATAVLGGMSGAGSFLEAAFSAATPATIPSDLLLTIYAQNAAGGPATIALLVDELSLIYNANPYLDTAGYISYANNPEGIDSVTGKFGPAIDTHKLMDLGVIRDTLYLATQDPSGRIHETSDNGVTEPAGWTVSEVAANCGTLSAFALTRSQADDSSASGGEEWLAWASSSGPRIFGGGEVYKIAQEIQPNWTGDANRGYQGLNFAAGSTVWALNDPTARMIYFGVPSLDVQGAGGPTAPNLILALNYRELDSAYAIAMSAPVHTSFSGKLIATDNTRKWAPWYRTLNGAALLYRSQGELTPVFFAGNGFAPNPLLAGSGNVYTLNAAKLTDDDYGQISSYYTTYFFVNHDQEQMLQLGAHRKMLCYLTAFVSGVGTVTITPLVNTLTNAWPLVCRRTLAAAPRFDLEWPGASATGQRMAFRIASSPLPNQTDNAFNLQKLVAALKPNARLPIRGAAA